MKNIKLFQATHNGEFIIGWIVLQGPSYTILSNKYEVRVVPTKEVKPYKGAE